MHGMEKRGHKVRLTQATLADDDDRAALVWSDSLYTFQEIMGWVSDLKKLRGRDLGRSGVAFVGKLDRRALEALPLEFLA
jgi:hypothetical protein